MGQIIVDNLTIDNTKDSVLELRQNCKSIHLPDIIKIDKNQADTLHSTIEVHFKITSVHDLYEKAIRALIVAEAPEFSPNGVVKDMDATNERKFADSTPVLLVAHIFGKKNTQVAADVIGQAREPEYV